MKKINSNFILMVNAYYQAEAYSLGMIASGVFGQISIQSELQIFRNYISTHQIKLQELLLKAESSNELGKIEKATIAYEFEKINLNHLFTYEIENSIENFKKRGGDMTSYRISFQLATDSIIGLVGNLIKHLDHLSLRESTSAGIDSIMNQNHWSGENLLEQINDIRLLKNVYGFTDHWIKEYTFQIFN